MPTIYRFQFTSTLKDLLAAEDADMTERTMRMSLRWAVSFIGLAMAVTGVADIIVRVDLPTALLRTIAGSLLVYYLFVRSCLRRYHIRKHNSASQELALEFGDECIHIEAEGRGTFRRDWSELVSITNTRRGVLLYFDDGTINWLPIRVFRDEAEKSALVAFLLNRINECADALYDSED